MDNKYIKRSLDGFNGSPNCDHSSVGAFISSYVKRKKEIISKKQPFVNQDHFNMNKFLWHKKILKAILNPNNIDYVCRRTQKLLDIRYYKYKHS